MRIYSLLLIVILFTCQMGYAINPMREYKMKPDRFNIQYEELKLKTDDGHSLNVWAMEPFTELKRNFTFVIVGSDAGNMGFSLAYAYHLLKRGFRVITFDYRGFGESSDFNFIRDSVYHREYIKDFETIMMWANKTKKTEKIGVLGFSMGTLIASSGYHTAQYDLFVGEAFVLSPMTNARRVKKVKNKKLQVPKSANKDINKLKDVKIPMLLFASRNDRITTLRDCKKLARRAANRKVIEFEGRHLGGAEVLGMKRYFDEIEQMISR